MRSRAMRPRTGPTEGCTFTSPVRRAPRLSCSCTEPARAAGCGASTRRSSPASTAWPRTCRASGAATNFRSSRTVTADLVGELTATRVPARRAHVVGLSWGGALAHTLLDRHPGLVDRAVIDGAGVLTWWAGRLILAGVTIVSPFLHTRPVTALFSGLIGMDDEGRAAARLVTPGVPARVRGGLHIRRLPRRGERSLADPARRRGEGDGGPTGQRGAGLADAARGRQVRARTRSWLARPGAGAARADGGGLAHRAGASLRAQARDAITPGRGATPPRARRRVGPCDRSACCAIALTTKSSFDQGTAPITTKVPHERGVRRMGREGFDLSGAAGGPVPAHHRGVVEEPGIAGVKALRRDPVERIHGTTVGLRPADSRRTPRG